MPILGTVSSSFTEFPYTLSQTFNTSGTYTVPAGKTKIATLLVGGGGGGGYMYLIYGSITNTGTITVAGGTGGLGIIGNGTGGAGANGNNGVAGTLVQINTTLGTLSQT